MIAYRCAWEITRNPAVRIIYVSATSKLAVKQLYFIKSILTSHRYRRFWPEMIHPEEGKREKWKEDEIAVDHPKRLAELVRDPTVIAAGLNTTVTGLHCDITVFDDVVVDDNVETETLREDVRTRVGYFASIGGTESEVWVVGTRYHPKDLYGDFQSQKFEHYDEDGHIIDVEFLYETFERVVEDKGDGTGTFLWPRDQRSDGKWFGFDRNILARKRAAYPDQNKFRAQYYNNPNDLSTATITADMFQYYDRRLLKQISGNWYFQGERLNIGAAVDFAYSLSKQADYSTIVVVGVNSKRQYFILDMDRFKTDRPHEYFQRILRLQQKWDFRKIKMETTGAQKVIVNTIVEDYIKPAGIALSVEHHLPQKGTKEERIEATLQSKYNNRQMWHYRDGLTSELEEELVLKRPAHDDIKDALASCVESLLAPNQMASAFSNTERLQVHYNKRFGGIGVALLSLHPLWSFLQDYSA